MTQASGRTAPAALIASFALAGCGGPASPSIPLFGAYFPFWLLCAAAGVLGASVLRLIFVRIGLDDLLPLRLLVYVCLGTLIALVLSLAVYGR